MMTAGRRVFVIGLDCAEPSLVFGEFRHDCPNLDRLMRQGTYGELESTLPCITVPAWLSMMTSRDPGQLGLYGFHNRPDHSYAPMTIADSTAISAPTVWDLASVAGRTVVLVGVPPSYPPRPVNGVMVGCFLTPNTDTTYTYPATVADEIRSVVGDYHVDVPKFRTDDTEYLLRQLYEMTERRFTLVRHLMTTRPWDFFMFVEIGIDRAHHGLWHYHDSRHVRHVAGNRYATALRDYYRYVDARVGEVLALIDESTVVLVVSDHGAKAMAGGVSVNQWLVEHGYLAVRNGTEGIVALERCEIDWSRTRAWAGGGYYGRVFLNVAGREPAGTISLRDYDAVRDEIAAGLESVRAPDGRPMATTAYRPERIYRERRGVPPDLIVYFDDLAWRAVGTLGHGSVYVSTNDTGPDGANHAQRGIVIHHDPRRRGAGHIGVTRLTDIAPLILETLGLGVDPGMIGRVPEPLRG